MSAQQQAETPYNFEYDVNDAANYVHMSHQAKNDGNIVSGSYQVLLPDGRTQTVTYKDGGYGYVADVKYDGHSKSIGYATAPTHYNAQQHKHYNKISVYPPPRTY